MFRLLVDVIVECGSKKDRWRVQNRRGGARYEPTRGGFHAINGNAVCRLKADCHSHVE